MNTSSIKRDRAVAIALVLVLTVSLTGIAGVFLVETWFKPAGGLLGMPTRIPTCGRDYRGPGRVETRAEIDAEITPGYDPVILEPTMGWIPFGAPFRAHTDPCDTLVFLHTGADAYVVYALLGGP